ncbi:MAG: hypothetical protein GTO71_04040 [Woeseiaceae bacterium]|nr:hypothetical protein [Woeseiaceae bacterium]NIP20271.1 hypothetical protein [Woeseiaceae bacterium]
MIGDSGGTRDPDDVDDVDDVEEDASEDTIVSDGDLDDDNIGDISVEINVEELVAKIEASDDGDLARKRDVRRRLDELQERRRSDDDLDSTYNFDLDDDL